MSKDKVIKFKDFKVCSDNGNSSHKMIINSETIYTNPNVCAKKNIRPNTELQDFDTVIDHLNDNLLIDINSPSVSENGTYYIGLGALNCGEYVRSVEVGVDNSKIDADVIPINLFGAIAGHCVKIAYEDNKIFYKDLSKILVGINLATSLPLNQYVKSNIDKFKSRLLGTHIVKVIIAKEIITVEIHVETCNVLGEGITSAWCLSSIEEEFFKDFNSKYPSTPYNNKEIMNKKILHIDIGEGTTEYPITQGVSFDVNFVTGTFNGIGIAINKALSKFKKEVNLPEYSRQAFSEVLKNNSDIYNKIAMDSVSSYIKDECKSILETAKGELRRANNNVDIILVYGGGSISMRETLEPLLNDLCEKTKRTKLFYVSTKYAVNLGILGLNSFTYSSIFNRLNNI